MVVVGLTSYKCFLAFVLFHLFYFGCSVTSSSSCLLSGRLARRSVLRCWRGALNFDGGRLSHQVLLTADQSNAFDDVSDFQALQVVLALGDVSEDRIASVKKVGSRGGQLRVSQQEEELRGAAVGFELASCHRHRPVRVERQHGLLIESPQILERLLIHRRFLLLDHHLKRDAPDFTRGRVDKPLRWTARVFATCDEERKKRHTTRLLVKHKKRSTYRCGEKFIKLLQPKVGNKGAPLFQLVW